MDMTDFINWKSAVRESNEQAKVILNDRDDLYRWISDEVKEAFTSVGNPVPKIHVNSYGSEISCTWGDKIRLTLDADLINDLHMEFDFNRRLTDTGEWVKEIVFYPFGREE